MREFEQKLQAGGVKVVIGIDEAGRGPLAGPVVAAAVWLRSFEFASRIDDSKKLSPAQRDTAYAEILVKSIWGLGVVGEQMIDTVNIRNATRLAMEEAAVALTGKLAADLKQSVHILVDGDMPLTLKAPCTTVIKGDSRSLSIAAASILAKVTRDRMMAEYDKAYPCYGFLQHKGYPTRMHRDALKKFGPSPVHRKSFCGVGAH